MLGCRSTSQTIMFGEEGGDRTERSAQRGTRHRGERSAGSYPKRILNVIIRDEVDIR